MDVKLEELVRENFNDVIELEVEESQKKFIESNLHIIAESKFSPACQQRVIYFGDKVVGFLEYEFGENDHDKDCCTIWRIMIDRKYQNTGIGKTAFAQLLKEIKASKRCDFVDVYYKPNNFVAEKLYSNFGFKIVGDRDDGTVIAIRKL